MTGWLASDLTASPFLLTKLVECPSDCLTSRGLLNDWLTDKLTTRIWRMTLIRDDDDLFCGSWFLFIFSAFVRQSLVWWRSFALPLLLNGQASEDQPRTEWWNEKWSSVGLVNEIKKDKISDDWIEADSVFKLVFESGKKKWCVDLVSVIKEGKISWFRTGESVF